MFPELPVLKHLAPKKRLRGKRGYFRSIQKKANDFDVAAFGLTDWDYWHEHSDWPGWGNRGWSWRRRHVRALATRLANIASHAADFPVPFQVWMTLACYDAGQDAVWLATPNSAGSTFPFRPQFTDARFPRLERELCSLLPGHLVQVREHICHDPDESPPSTDRTLYAFVEGIGESFVSG